MRTLIRYASVVLPQSIEKTHLLIEDSKILEIDAAEHSDADEIVDCKGLHVIPGVIDDQVHFRDPGLTHKEDLHTGSRACAKGGITTFFEMPNTNPTTTSCQRLEEKLALASEKCVVNYGFFIGATEDNLEELQQAKRTPGIKIFIGSSTGNLLVDEQAALEKIFAETSLPICAHCEDETTIRENREKLGEPSSVADHSKIRDHHAAWVATKRAIDLSKKYEHRFHVLHVSTRQELDLIKAAQGIVTAEVCPHHLFFNIQDYERLGSLVQMNPSIKDPADNTALWEALKSNTIQVVATDHAPHLLEEKEKNYPQSPSGLPAVENSLALMLNQVNLGKCTLQEVVHWMCEAPARVWDLTNKGRIEKGADADLVLIDMAKSDTIFNENQVTKAKWSPWHGTTLTGWPVRTWVRGKTVFQNGIITTKPLGEEAIFDHSLKGYWDSV
ncbi:Dihydroorotase [Planctomycetales bacterium 10988]|nr:Dihydroorotase [Planctomycetales bacterium 10988]